MTILSVYALSLSKARGLKPDRNTLLVSILGTQEASAMRRPALAGWRSVLVLEFEDVSEEKSLAKAGDWPREPSEEEHRRLLGGASGQLPSLAHAHQLVEFLLKHHGSKEPLSLVVHCQAGVSRSVMVSSKVSDWCGMEPDARILSLLPHANARWGRLLDMARLDLDVDRLFTQAAGKKPSP